MIRHHRLRAPRLPPRQPTARGEPEIRAACPPTTVLRALAGGRPALARLPTLALQRAAVTALGQRSGNAAVQRLLAPPNVADLAARGADKARKIADAIDTAKKQKQTLRRLLNQTREELKKRQREAESDYVRDNVEGLLPPIVGEVLGGARTDEEDLKQSVRETRDMLEQVTNRLARLTRQRNKIVGSWRS